MRFNADSCSSVLFYSIFMGMDVIDLFQFNRQDRTFLILEGWIPLGQRKQGLIRVAQCEYVNLHFGSEPEIER